MDETFELLVDKLCNGLNVKREELICLDNKDRHQKIYFTKYFIAKQLRKSNPRYYTYDRIASLLMYKSHASSIWAIKEYSKMVGYDKFDRHVELCNEIINQKQISNG